jgi:hypothetical protein
MCVAAERDKYGPGVIDQFYKLWDGSFLGLNDDPTIAPYAPTSDVLSYQSGLHE